MKRRSVSRIIAILILTGAVAGLSVACKNPFEKEPDAPRYGSLTVSAYRNDGARTLRPADETLQAALYFYHLVGPASVTVDETSTAAAITIADLVVGDWTVAVAAKNTVGVTLLSSAAVAFTVTENQTSSVSVPMVAASGTGTVAITIDLTDAMSLVSAVTGTIKDEVNGGDQINIDSKINYSLGIATYADTVAAGTYSLIMSMKNAQGNTVGMIIEMMDVFAGIATSPTLVVNAGNLNKPPLTPTGLVVAGATTSTLNISWNTVIGATSYQLYRDTDAGGAFATSVFNGAALSYTDTGLNAETIYYYKVSAINPFGTGVLSEVVSGTTMVPNVMIAINAAGDSFVMGDGTYGPNLMQTISYNYEMSKFEITNAEYALFIADGGYTTQSYWTTNGWAAKTTNNWIEPFHWTDVNYSNPNQPVVGISWYEVVAYCNWRSAKEGFTSAYASNGLANLNANGYRLPTEVEWEYAAAKGAPGQAERALPWGDVWDSNKCVNYVEKTEVVGSKSPSGDTPQGLCDVAGNVWEWCGDNWQNDVDVVGTIDRYYFAIDSADHRFVIRGASWYIGTDGGCFWCGDRAFTTTSSRPFDIGIRVVRSAATSVPTAPSGLTAAVVSSTQIRLNWTDASSTEAGFKIERSTDGSSGWTQIATAAKNVAFYDNTGLAQGTTYYYRVKAWNGGGDSLPTNTASAIAALPQVWAKAYGGTSGEIITCTIVPNSGGYISCGYTPVTSSADGLIIRLDNAGNILWQKTYSGNAYDYFTQIIQLSDGNFAVCGVTNSWGAGYQDMWIVKIDASGAVLWERTYGGGGWAGDGGQSIIQAADGNLICGGGTNSYGVGGDYYGTDAWLIKVNESNGDAIWQKTLGANTGGDSIRYITKTTDGGYILSGFYDAGNTSPHDGYVFAIKFDQTDQIQWQRSYGGTGIDGGFFIKQTADSGFVIIAETNAFGPAGGANGMNGWVIKIESDGSIEWQKVFGGTADDRLYSATELPGGGFLVYGSTYSFGAGDRDLWLLRLDSAGAKVWERTYGGAAEEYIENYDREIHLTSSGGFLISGSTKSYGAGDYDALLISGSLSNGTCGSLGSSCESQTMDTNATANTIDAIITLTGCTITTTSSTVVNANLSTYNFNIPPLGSSGITLTGGLLQDYSVTFTVSGAQAISAPDASGLYPMYTISQAALPITVSVTSVPTATAYQWLLNGTEQASTSSIIVLSSLAIQNHYLTLRLKNGTDPWRSATIIMQATN